MNFQFQNWLKLVPKVICWTLHDQISMRIGLLKHNCVKFMNRLKNVNSLSLNLSCILIFSRIKFQSQFQKIFLSKKKLSFDRGLIRLIFNMLLKQKRILFEPYEISMSNMRPNEEKNCFNLLQKSDHLNSQDFLISMTI